jgi:hypothetical protein
MAPQIVHLKEPPSLRLFCHVCPHYSWLQKLHHIQAQMLDCCFMPKYIGVCLFATCEAEEFVSIPDDANTIQQPVLWVMEAAICR